MTERIPPPDDSSLADELMSSSNELTRRSREPYGDRLRRLSIEAAWALGFTAVGLTAVYGSYSIAESRQTARADHAEAAAIARSRNGSTEDLNREVVLLPGSTYSDAPDQVGRHFFGLIHGNEHTVPNGQVLVMVRPTRQQRDNRTVYGAALSADNRSCLQKPDDSPKGFIPAETIAKLQNVYTVAEPQHSNEFLLPNPTTHNNLLNARYAANGVMEVVPSGQIAACAYLLPETDYTIQTSVGGIGPRS